MDSPYNAEGRETHAPLPLPSLLPPHTTCRYLGQSPSGEYMIVLGFPDEDAAILFQENFRECVLRAGGGGGGGEK